MEQLTLQNLKEMKPHKIFAKGFLIDSPSDINLANTGKNLRWVAVRGERHDWAIFVQNSFEEDAEKWDKERLRDFGDKVFTEHNIRKLVPCNDEAFEMYNY